MKLSAVVGVTLSITMVVACGGSSSTPSAAAESPVEGTWRVAEVTVTGATPSMTVDPPSVFIFGKTHYSMMRVVGAEPRASFKTVSPTSEEKVAAYDTFIANTGTYELAGSTLTVRPVVAKHPNFMGGGFDTYDVQREGEALVLTGKSTNIRYHMGGGLVSDPDNPNQTRLKLVRVQ